ncbi:MAG: ferric reductase family protein [uncultured bacterium]|nr:MAG: ferric reductase family protein [uncultured bacterium]
MKINLNNCRNFFHSSAILLAVLVLMFFFLIGNAKAQIAAVIDYGSELILDSDMDGLTDKGERQLFGTDSGNIDTDKDGYQDGVEVIGGYDPNDSTNFPGEIIPIPEQENSQSEIPWVWYLSRVGGLVAFLLLYISIFLGLTIRIPLLRKIFSPIYSVGLHCLISLYATLFALLHGTVLIFDKMIGFKLYDVIIPFVSKFETNLIALGILGFYLMVILVATSYGRKLISQKLWRATHFTNIVLYVIVLVHAVKLGTDLKNPLVFDIFLWANAFLVLVILYNIELRISDAIKIRK